MHPRLSLQTLAFLAAVLAGFPIPASAAPDRAADAPVSVTFDFASGVKTTTLADGTILEEAFDERKARRLASRRTANGVTSNLQVPPN